MGIPKVPGGAELGVSESGELHESRPWSIGKWLLMLPLGIGALFLFWPLLFVGPMWFALAALLIGAIWKMWHDYRAAS
jgi:hypothetical protein